MNSYKFWVGISDGVALLFVKTNKPGQTKDAVLVIPITDDFLSQLVYKNEKHHLEIRSAKKETSLIFATERQALRAQRALARKLKKTQKSSRTWLHILAVGLVLIGLLLASALSVKIAPTTPISAGTAAQYGEEFSAARRIDSLKPAYRAGVIEEPETVSFPEKIDVSIFPDGASWDFGNPEGKNLYVFSDPLCTHCQDLEKTLIELEDELYIHVFPVPRISGRSGLVLGKIACEANPKKAWRTWMTTKVLSAAQCESPERVRQALEAGSSNLGLMAEFGFAEAGTPVIVRHDGQVMVGIPSEKEALVQWLTEKNGSKKKSNP